MITTFRIYLNFSEGLCGCHCCLVELSKYTSYVFHKLLHSTNFKGKIRNVGQKHQREMFPINEINYKHTKKYNINENS